MRTAIRLGVVSGLALAFAGAPGWGFAEDAETKPVPEEAAPKEKVPCEVSDPCVDILPGAPGMEPEPDQAIMEGEGAKAHRDWVESIWSTP